MANATQNVYIGISGTPGTGKTTLAKAIAAVLSSEHATYVNISDIVKKNKLYASYDASAKTYDVSISKLEAFLKKYITALQTPSLKSKSTSSKIFIFDSHLSHHFSSKLMHCVVVSTCELKILARRLHLRKYSAKKIADNLEAEIFDTCATESLEQGHPVLKVDCSHRLAQKQLLQLSRKALTLAQKRQNQLLKEKSQK